MEKEMNLQMSMQETISANVAKLNANGRIQVKQWTKQKIATTVLFSVLIVLTIWFILTIDTRGLNIETAVPNFLRDARRMFFEPNISQRTTWVYLLTQLGITVGVGLISSLAGAVVSFFLALGAARNLSKPWVSTIVRGFMSFVRAVPSIVLILVFALVIGLGPVSAVVGLVFQGMAFLVKAYSESIEELDEGIIEALKASGAGWWQIVFQAVLPSCLTAMISWTFIRFEINFGHALALGAAAGAGGLGFRLAMAGTFYHDLHEVGLIVFMLLGVALVLELVSMQLRKKLLVKS